MHQAKTKQNGYVLYESQILHDRRMNSWCCHQNTHVHIYTKIRRKEKTNFEFVKLSHITCTYVLEIK
jgi:hypothetical protein